MRDQAVALVLTYAEAGALFETANLGQKRREELGMTINPKTQLAIAKIAVGMGFAPKMDGAMVLLGEPRRDQLGEE